MSVRTIYTIDVIAGDGIGLEVRPAAIACVDSLGPAFGFSVDWRHRDWGSRHYRRRGRMMPLDGLEQLATGDATLLGAVGAEDIPDDVTLWGLLIPIRREFDQYVNLRPIRVLPGVTSPLAGIDELDMVVVRENVEGEYSEIGGRMYRGRPQEAAIQEAVFTRAGVERVAEYAVDLAMRRDGRLVSATKSNGIIHTMPFWDEVVEAVAARTPNLTLEKVLIDALAARLVLKPRSMDVNVASNLFGDILSDLAAAVAGSIGVAPSANLNPRDATPPCSSRSTDRRPTSPTRASRTPSARCGQRRRCSITSGSPQPLTPWLAPSSTPCAGIRTRDLGGSAGTGEFTMAVLEHCRHVDAAAAT